MRVIYRFVVFLIIFSFMFTEHVSLIKAGHSNISRLRQTLTHAFTSGKPNVLSSYFSDNHKVFVSIPEIGIVPGNYSRSQLMALLSKSLKQVKTKRFSIQQGAQCFNQKGPIKAEWIYFHKLKKKTFRTTLYITVLNQSSGMFITAIRGSGS